jgi:uncharacterized protein YecE (DUF72 family)
VRHAIRIGTAGWTIPQAVSKRFPGEGGQLARYARLFNAAEINTSFYRSHRPATYARWAECVPTDFRFSVKVPRTITHERRLVETNDLFENFLAEAAELGEKLGPLLIQLPPSLAFDPAVAETFFSVVRERFAGLIAFEPRHASWFEPQTEALLRAHEIARVAADPVWAEGGGEPDGWLGLVYMRLHGSPRVYFSSYDASYLENLSRKLLRHAGSGAPVWCIFDNTAHGAAAPNALAVLEMISR